MKESVLLEPVFMGNVNPFLACSTFIPPENTTKTFGFLVFSYPGNIKWEHWPEMY